MGRIRILLADDHNLICAGFQKLLEPQYDVVGCVGDGQALLKAAVQLKPDVVLVDVGMPLLNGLEAGKELKRLMPDIKLIFLTMNPDTDLARGPGPRRRGVPVENFPRFRAFAGS